MQQKIQGIEWPSPWKMALLYEKVVSTVSKDPDERTDAEIEQILPWFRKKSELFKSQKAGKARDASVLEKLIFFPNFTNNVKLEVWRCVRGRNDQVNVACLLSEQELSKVIGQNSRTIK